MMIAVGSRELTVLDQASKLLAEATSLDEIKTIRDKAEAARTYARAAKLGLELQNRAAEIKLRAERKAGCYLGTLKLRGGDRRSKQYAALTLNDLGISRDQSRRWQHLASVPEEEFDSYLKAMNQQRREVTSAGLLRIARKPRGGSRRLESMGIGLTIQSSTEIDRQDLLLELSNHCQLLADVLRPIYEEGAVDLKTVERRVVGRLITEMIHLIRDLNEEWARTLG